MATNYDDLSRSIGDPDDFAPMVLKFSGLEPFDDRSERRALELGAQLLQPLLEDLGAYVPTMQGQIRGEDVTVPDLDWEKVETHFTRELNELGATDVVILFAYWTGKWDQHRHADAVMYRASGWGLPPTTYALLARCCANEIMARIMQPPSKEEDHWPSITQ